MDGRGRLLRSLKPAGLGYAPAAMAYGALSIPEVAPARPLAPPLRQPRRAWGHPADIIAKALGFSIKAVTISGERELKEQDLLAVAEISPRNSLLFLDAAKIRERLQRLPLVKEAVVTKLYPDRLLIEIEERQPFALWQCDGNVQIVAADGVPLAAMRDQRFIHLPLVVGPGANERLNQYLALFDAAGGLREHIVAGA